MPYVPSISDYKPFYIQKESDANAVDIQATYGITIREHEYPLYRTPKEPYKNDWKDEHGDDEWTERMYVQAFTFTVECVIIGEDNTDVCRNAIRSQLQAFQDYVANGEFAIYDAWTTYGFAKVRISNYSNPEFVAWRGHSRLMFSMEFKVNDPVTPVSFSNNRISVA